MKHLGRLWRGELPLESAFWNWAVLGGLIVNVVSSVLFLFLLTAEQPIVALLVGYGLSIPYNILATVGVWRSPADMRASADGPTSRGSSPLSA